MRVLLIGYGSIGRRHARILAQDNRQAALEIVTGQKVDGLVTHGELAAVPDIAQFDYYIIASETHLHYPQLQFLTERVAGKVILVEKPLFAEAKSLDIQNNRVLVAYNLRFHPVIQAIKAKLTAEIVRSVNIQTAQYLPSWRPERDYRHSYSAVKAKGGGVLLDLSHEIDYLQWIYGELNEFAALRLHHSDLAIDSDDIVTLIGKTARDTVVTLTIDYLSKIPIRRMVVHTEELTLEGDLIANRLTFATKAMQLSTESFTVEPDYTYSQMHRAILAGENSAELCSYDEAFAVLHTISRVQEGWNYHVS